MAFLLAGTLTANARSNDENGADRAAEVFAYTRPDTYGILRTNDILVPMRDGFKLTCDLYQPGSPDGTLAGGQFPSFVKDYTGYGRRDYVTGGSDFVTQTLAAKGYNVIWCNARGSQGRFGTAPAPQSVALIRPWSEQEQQDNYDLIEWMAAQSWSNGKVGQTGASYGGITTWFVAARQRPPHLAAIAPIEASTDNYRHFTYPGGIKSSDLRGLWPSLCSLLTGEATCAPRVVAEFAAHPTYDSYWQERTADLRKVSIPTLYFAGHMDIFSVSMDPIVQAMRRNPDFSMIFGPWAHENVWTTPNAPIPVGVLLAFFDRWLGNDSSAPRIPDFIAYQSPLVAGDTNRWRAFDKWPPEGSRVQQWVLSPDGTLNASAKASGSVSYVAPAGSAIFDTAPFERDRVVAGPLDVELTASFSTTDALLFVRVDDVDETGKLTSMGYGGQLKMSHRVSDSAPEPVVPGANYRVTLQIPSKFWAIAKGHRVRLTVKSFDATSNEPAPPGIVTLQLGHHGGSAVTAHLWMPDRDGDR
jgi:predicted acyl esterase